jgi:uncharacterized protein (DUF1778 family)
MPIVNKSETVTARVTPAVHTLVVQAAELVNKRPSAWIADVVRTAALEVLATGPADEVQT